LISRTTADKLQEHGSHYRNNRLALATLTWLKISEGEIDRINVPIAILSALSGMGITIKG